MLPVTVALPSSEMNTFTSVELYRRTNKQHANAHPCCDTLCTFGFVNNVTFAANDRLFG